MYIFFEKRLSGNGRPFFYPAADVLLLFNPLPMLSKERIHFVKSLHQAKNRRETGLFLVEGPKLTEELLHSRFEIVSVYHTGEWSFPGDPPGIAEIQCIRASDLERISQLMTPNQVLAVARIPEAVGLTILPVNDIILVLDGIADPGNMGTILRIADWFGLRHVVCSPDCVDVFNPKVVQASMGSVFRVRAVYEDPLTLIQSVGKELPVFGAFLDGENVLQMSLETPAVLVIGSESHGIRPGVEPVISRRVWIPSYPSAEGSVAESLNASVACGILMHEFRRKQGRPAD